MIIFFQINDIESLIVRDTIAHLVRCDMIWYDEYACADVLLAMDPQYKISWEDRVAYFVSPWLRDIFIQCLSVEYHNVGVSLNTLAIFLQHEDELLQVRLYIYIHIWVHTNYQQ